MIGRPKTLTDEEVKRRILQRTADWKVANRDAYIKAQRKRYYKAKYGDNWEKIQALNDQKKAIK
jgi:hypothetical protein